MTAIPASPRVAPSASRDFDTYARERLGGLLRFGYVLTGSQAGAEDLVQETLARTFVVWRRVGERKDLDAYVRRIMLNLHRTWWRRRGRWEQATSTVPEVAAGDDTARHDDFDQLARALSRLPARQRSAVVLRYYLQLDERETAAAMGCRVGTVKSLSSRGLAQLRVVLGASWDGVAVTNPGRSRAAAPDQPVIEETRYGRAH